MLKFFSGLLIGGAVAFFPCAGFIILYEGNIISGKPFPVGHFGQDQVTVQCEEHDPDAIPRPAILKRHIKRTASDIPNELIDKTYQALQSREVPREDTIRE